MNSNIANVPQSTIEALAHDIDTEPSFHGDRWKVVKDSSPAFAGFMQERLLELLGDEESVSKALAAFVEAEDFQKRIDFAKQMSELLGLDPVYDELSQLSVSDQILHLESKEK